MLRSYGVYYSEERETPSQMEGKYYRVHIPTGMVIETSIFIESWYDFFKLLAFWNSAENWKYYPNL